MIILIFSDTHGDNNALMEMLEYEKIHDRIYCLGDSGFSKEFLEELNIVSVKGNYPFAPRVPYDISEKIHHHWFFFTHGHLYNVKFGLSRLIKKSERLKADVVCYGHTHRIDLQKKENLIILNPGALSYRKSYPFPSYMKVYIDELGIQIAVINLKTKEVVKQFKEV